MIDNMPMFPKVPSASPVPAALRPVVRRWLFVAVALVVAFVVEFELFTNGKISGLGFGVAVAVTIAVYTAIARMLRQAARKVGTELTAEEKLSLNEKNLERFRRLKVGNTVLLCFFGLGALMVLVNSVLNRIVWGEVAVPVALLGFGIWYRTTLNRAIETLEQKIRIDTLRGQ
jgi:hypothetical protein